MAEKKNTPGSPDGEPVYLAVGFLRRPHGLRGEVIMDLHTDFPERMKRGRKLYIGDAYQKLTLESVRIHQNGLLVKFKGVDSPEEAGTLRNQWAYIPSSDAPPLPDGQLYQHEIIGFNVFDEQEQNLGEVIEIIETGANLVYVVRDELGKEILLPAIPSVVLDLDAEQRRMRVHLLEGLV